MPLSESEKSSDEGKSRVEELRKLFKKTQALPRAKTISDDVIAEEIEKARNK